MYITFIQVICDELFHKFIHRRERSACVQLLQLHVQVQGIHGARYSPPWQAARRRNFNHENLFSFIMRFKINIFQKLKHQSYSTSWGLSNAFYRFKKFELYQELWTKNSEILPSKNGFSLFLGFKMNIFQKMKHQSYSTA